MSDFPWLRLYNETLTDRKVARICRDSNQPKAVVIGVWATTLMLASESPQRGKLLISDDLPLTSDEIRDETGLDAPAFDAVISGLSGYGLIDTSGPCWVICNWEKRQPPSDNSAERVRAYRERKRNGSETPTPNSGVALRSRNSHAIDKDIDIDKDKEGKSGADAATDLLAPFPFALTDGEVLSLCEERQNSSDPKVIIENYLKVKINNPASMDEKTYDHDWLDPIVKMLEIAGGDVTLAKSLIDKAIAEARRPKLKDGRPYKIVRPLGLLSFYQTQADDITLAAVAVEADTIWQQVRAALNNGFDTAPPPLQAALRAVGWPRIKEAKERDVPQLKQEVFNAYRNAIPV